MKLLALLLPMAVFGQLVTIQDNLTSPVNGRAFVGTVLIAPPAARSGGSTGIVPVEQTVNVVNGVFRVNLLPNTLMTPTGTSYRVTYRTSDGRQSWSEYWVVPEALAPIEVADVRVNVAPAPGVSVSLSQISATGTGCVQVVNGVTTVAPCPTGTAAPTQFVKSFSLATVLTIPQSEHSLPTAPYLVWCVDEVGDPVEPDLVKVTTAGLVEVRFLLAQAGACTVQTAPSYYEVGLGALAAVAIPASDHLMGKITGVVCYGTDDVVVAADVSMTPVLLEQAGSFLSSFDISVAFAEPQSGRCAVLGGGA
jgi:hypothetical protein